MSRKQLTVLALEDLYLRRLYGDPDAPKAMTTAAAKYGLDRNNLKYHMRTNAAVQVMVADWKR